MPRGAFFAITPHFLRHVCAFKSYSYPRQLQSASTYTRMSRRPQLSKRQIALCMKFVTSIALAGCLFMIGIFSACAQAPTAPGGQPPERRVPDDLAKTLKLTAKQSPAVEAIIDAERSEMRALREATRAKADAIQANAKQKLAKLLNAEQLGRYEEWKQANRPPRFDGGQPRRDGDEPPSKRRP